MVIFNALERIYAYRFSPLPLYYILLFLTSSGLAFMFPAPPAASIELSSL